MTTLFAENAASLNDVVVTLYRSLVQYTVECWPWSSANQGALQSLLQRLATEQQASVTAIVDAITERGGAVELGVYPTEFTDLHYVSVGYLTKQIIADEQRLVAFLQAAAESWQPLDTQIAELLAGVAAQAVGHVAELKAAQAAIVK